MTKWDRSRRPGLSDDIIAKASELWRAGLSAAAIGRAIGRSKGSVLGMSFRDRERFPRRNSGGWKSQW